MEQTNRKTILLLGAAGGIGRVILKALKNDYAVLAVDQDAHVLELAEPDVTPYQLDLLRPECRQTLQKALEVHDNLYGAVIATGYMLPGSITELSDEAWDQTISVNLTMVSRVLKLVIPQLLKQKTSHIIAMASHLGTVGAYNLSAYCASKAALIELMKCVALDYGDKGLIANCISPGFVKTEMLAHAMGAFAVNKKWMFATGGLPKQHIDPNDIANMVCLLLRQTCMNGENIVIDAGYTVR